MRNAARGLYAQCWKTMVIPLIDEWWMMLMDFAEIDKIMTLLK